MNSIGGFFELELPRGKMYRCDGIHLLNSARNALAFFIQQNHIQRLFVPSYNCSAIWDILESLNCSPIYYEIGNDFLPDRELRPEEWVLYNNYFGICDSQVESMLKLYPRLIIDNSQAYFCNLGNVAIYSPRKFFGVPDGGELKTEKRFIEALQQDVSIECMSHLLQRIEFGANTAYPVFKQNEKAIGAKSIMRMSRLTQRILGSIDYSAAAKIRRDNFRALHEVLQQTNRLSLNLRDCEVPMVYPYLPYLGGEEIKRHLIQHNIYIATYWPGQKSNGFGSVLENNLVALPIDQRYGRKEMMTIIEVLYEKTSKSVDFSCR